MFGMATVLLGFLPITEKGRTGESQKLRRDIEEQRYFRYNSNNAHYNISLRYGKHPVSVAKSSKLNEYIVWYLRNE